MIRGDPGVVWKRWMISVTAIIALQYHQEFIIFSLVISYIYPLLY